MKRSLRSVKKKANFFKEKREKAGLSQLEVAEALGYSSAQFVSNWERDLCQPPLEKLGKLSQLLNLSRSEVIEYFVDETRKNLMLHLANSRTQKKAKGM